MRLLLFTENIIVHVESSMEFIFFKTPNLTEPMLIYQDHEIQVQCIKLNFISIF